MAAKLPAVPRMSVASVMASVAVAATLLTATALASLPSPAELARGHGYDAEAHTALTEDGYLLGMFRVRKAGTLAADKDPVLIVAGLACNAAIWVLLGPGKALAYLLADRGYDVWLGDYRGSRYSRRHANLSDHDARFWNFSLDDIGRQDVPAMLRLVVRESGRPSVTYVGHSMGAGVLTVMASALPRDQGAALVARAYLLAPAVFMGHVSEPAIANGADAVNRLHDAIGLFSSGEIPLSSGLMRFAIYGACSTSLVLPTCLLVNGMFVGHDVDQVNKTELSLYLDYLPDSIAVKNVLHFLQHFRKVGDFRRFDYGVVRNRAVYGADQPPEYNLSCSTFPVSVYYGDNDFLVRPQDVLDFSKKLPNLVRPPHRIARDQFNHVDFFLAMDAKALLYDRLLRDLEEDEARPQR